MDAHCLSNTKFQRLRRASGLAVCALYAVWFQAQSAHAQCTPSSPCVTTPLDLGTLGGSYSNGMAVNADGSVVVGYAHTSGDANYRAFRWTSGGMIDLGTFGGDNAIAQGVNADGSVVVGYAYMPGNSIHRAFRWTIAGMVDLGGLGGDYANAVGVNADGSVVVGYAHTPGNSAYHAFRWTSAGMVDLGTLGGDYSNAQAVNADGTVVVGSAYTAGNATNRAFRWTSSGMADLGTLGGSYSDAYGVNADGSVVVGGSHLSGDTTYHAFRWTSIGGMVDLGTLGGDYSYAFGVNADGTIVVGYAYTAGNAATRAFRWTSAGMRDLNTLLTDAGVNMSGIVLTEARGISANGQFIVGTGDFSGSSHAYVVRYFDMETTPGAPPVVIAGLTTGQDVVNSLKQLSDARFGAMAQQHGFAVPLLGGDKPMGLGSEVGVFASIGSFSAGGQARFAFGNGFALLGGLAYSREDLDQVEIRDSLIAAAALQYVHSGSILGLRPFAEAGGWMAPDASLTLERTYANGAGTATGVGHPGADTTYLYGRAGLLHAFNRDDQVAVSAEVGRARMEVGAYSETLSATNPFEAHVAEGTDTMDLVKLKAQWSHRFTSAIDATIWIAGVRDLNRSSTQVASVPGFGTLAIVNDGDGSTWAEYGVRVGYRLTDNVIIDAFANGVSGAGAIDTHVHSGAALRLQY